MSVKIALAGNPNSGKTTMFNALTGSNQFVGNWPGVTVEKKEGKLKGHKDVIIMDLPGIYSLSPYTLEEVVSRNYLIGEKPDVIINIVDGTNLERNLYLTTQLLELSIPVIMAVNMMDVVDKNGDVINFKVLGEKLGCEVVAVSALKNTGIMDAAEKAIKLSRSKAKTPPVHSFSVTVEGYLSSVEAKLGSLVTADLKRFYAIKLFERDDKIKDNLSKLPDISDIINEAETELDDDSESIITNERYTYISSIISGCYKKRSKHTYTATDKIDRIVTNRVAALPIFAIVMFIIYYISVTTVGTIATDWANEGVFGDGWHLFGIGAGEYEEQLGDWDIEQAKLEAFIEAAGDEGIDVDGINEYLESEEPDEELLAEFLEESKDIEAVAEIEGEEGEIETLPVSVADFEEAIEFEEPDPAEFGIWVVGIPVIVEAALVAMGTAEWLNGLILDGIIGGVGAVLGFVPQMLILFLLLAFVEACGYMARVAFILDRIFRRFGLSGKAFIPILIGTGCGVPGVMASRTIENDRDRKMTIITTTFIPCGAKLPIIALIAGGLFGGAWWVASSAYFIGIAAIITSGIILKKTKMFAGDPAPFVMELPKYHMPTISNMLRSMWERGWSFIKKAGTIVLLSTVFVWFASSFGIVDGQFMMVEDLSDGFLAVIGNLIAWMFAPLGWGNWQAAVAAVTGLIAKENVVGTFGVLYGFAEVSEDGVEIWSKLAESYTAVSAYSFLVFNLLCAPCFAAIGAIKREMNNIKWTWFAIGYQTIFAYLVSLCVYQLGSWFVMGQFGIGAVLSILIIIGFFYLLFRPYRESDTLVMEPEKKETVRS